MMLTLIAFRAQGLITITSIVTCYITNSNFNSVIVEFCGEYSSTGRITEKLLLTRTHLTKTSTTYISSVSYMTT